MTDAPIRIDLGDGHFALIDPIDAHLSGWGWTAKIDRTNTYAVRRRANGGIQSLHRAIMGEPDGIVDHIHGDGLNCTRGNLRVTTHRGNRRNVAGAQSNSTSGYLGVSWHRGKGKWLARIHHEGRSVYLGAFDTAEEANTMRLAAEFTLWGVEPRRASEMAPIIEAAKELA